MNRRSFINHLSVVPLGLMVNNISSPPLSKAKIKLSLNAWSYNVPLYQHLKGKPGGMSLFDLLEECARLEFDAVDPTGYFFPGYPKVPDASFLNEFKRRAFLLGLDISGTGIRNNFATSDKAKRDADIDLTKQWIEVAAEMGAPVLRVFAGAQPEGFSWEETAGWMAEALAECADYGENFGVMIGVQNHGGMLKSADEVLRIMELVRSDWLGTIVDTGYFLTPDPYKDIEKVIPYAVNWQVKELLNDRKGGEIDMNKLVGLIRASEYRGYVPIETLPMRGKEDEYDALVKVPQLLAKLRKALEE